MKCPVCKTDMIVVEYSGIELDHCLDCGGVWFDAGELDLLMKTAGMEGVLSIPSEETLAGEKKRKCPLCAASMKKTHIGSPEQVLLDVCPQGDGIWFDGGELGQLFSQIAQKGNMPGGAQQEIVRFIGEVFKSEH